MKLYLNVREILPGNACSCPRRLGVYVFTIVASLGVLITVIADGQSDTHTCTTLHWRYCITPLREAAEAVWGKKYNQWPDEARNAFPCGDSTHEPVTHEQVAMQCKELEDALWGKGREQSCAMRTAHIMAALWGD